jgi:DNA-binding MarR family transcriptional regulator
LPCGCANLRRAARAATQVYDDELRAAGLNIAQFTLLQALSLTREVTQGALGRLLAIDSTTLTRTLKPLEGKGWIRRRPGEDRREKYIVLMSAGRAAFRRAVPAWNRAQSALRARVGRRRWHGFMAELSRIAVTSRAP